MLATRMLENRRNRRWRGRYDGIRLCRGGDRCAASVPRTRRTGAAAGTPGRRDSCRKSPTAGRGVGRSPAPVWARIIVPVGNVIAPAPGMRACTESNGSRFAGRLFRTRMRRWTGAVACERSDTDLTHDAPACRGVVRSGQVVLPRLRRTRVCAGGRRRQPGPSNPQSRSYNAQSTRMPATSAFGRSRVRDGSLNWSGCTM